MKNKKSVRILFSLLQIAIIIVINSILPLGDGWLPLWGIGFIIIAFFLKSVYGSWAIVLAYPISYVLGNLFDTPHPIDGRLPNNMYSLWYLIFIGSSIAILIFEVILKVRRDNRKY